MEDKNEFSNGLVILEEVNSINKATKLGEIISLRIQNQNIENDGINIEKTDDDFEL